MNIPRTGAFASVENLLKMMIATVFVCLVLAIGIHVEAGPTPNLKDEIDTDIGCSENHQQT